MIASQASEERTRSVPRALDARRHQTPPLDTTFFELCRLADLHGRGAVRSYLIESFGIDPFDGEHRMEEVFNYLYSQAFADNPTLECLEAYWGLIRM